MKSIKIYFSVFAMFFLLNSGIGPYDYKSDQNLPYFIQRRGDRYYVKPKMIDSVLINPNMGFTTFQRFNGDTLNPKTSWTEGFPIEYQNFNGDLQNQNHPQTSIAYWRIYWRYLEPEEDQYRWDMIDKALKTARERGQTLLLRVAPYGTGVSYNKEDVPVWYRKMVGDKNWNEKRWMVDPDDPRYADHFGEFIRELGKKYDGHPDLELIDISIVGAWGEGAGTSHVSDIALQKLYEAYIDAFKKTPMVAQPKSLDYINSRIKIGWRVDCIGDLGFRSREKGMGLEGWNHMTDYYPFALINNNLQENWKHSPVSFEIGRTFHYWKDHMNYSVEDVRYIIDESLKWHITNFNTKSCPVPDDEEWKAEMDRWLIKMGYRICLRRITYPVEIKAGEYLDITSWWENKGVAPCYRKYPVVFRLKNDANEYVLKTSIDLTEWLPGDHLYNDEFQLPKNLQEGSYDLAVSILDLDGKEPKVKMGIAGIQSDGLYPLGSIQINNSN